MTHALRHPQDFYPTPPQATRALLSVESFHGPIWEPACGDGAIAKVLAAARLQVISTDLVFRGWGEGGINFLNQNSVRAPTIITNPPYGAGLADAFIRHALALTRPLTGSVAMLLDLASLAHPKRTALFLSSPPTAIYILDELICQPGGISRITQANQRFCWCVWRPHHAGRPSVWWLSPSRFKHPDDRP